MAKEKNIHRNVTKKAEVGYIRDKKGHIAQVYIPIEIYNRILKKLVKLETIRKTIEQPQQEISKKL